MKERLQKYQTAGVDSGVIVPPPPFPKRARERDGQTDIYTYKEREGVWKGREKERR